MSGHFFTISPFRSALPIHDVNIHKDNGIGGNYTSAPIGKADQVCRMNIRTIKMLRIFLVLRLTSVIQKVKKMRQYIGGVTAERKSCLRFAFSSRHRPLI
jgi:hypothetical protein